MVRNIVLVKLAPGQDPAAVAEAQSAFLDLNCPGTLSYLIADDLGLRDGNWSFAIVADFADADAYRAYDQDEEHNRARAGLLPMTEQIARVQFEMPCRGPAIRGSDWPRLLQWRSWDGSSSCAARPDRESPRSRGNSSGRE
jgi:hypothetical protein